ncbi:reverse transcriptase family protein [Comamonas sp. J-3]|uniref:reverse transcriptase family protein n=1 Tax=Comamonas trifloxystrobinivorans TaxID=3350256 RepID=UPI00372BB41D
MRPYYNARPIGSLASLSQTLQVDLGILKNTAKEIEKHYHPHSIPKKNGGERSISIPSNHLKIIQKRINKKIFGNVTYPPYLHGGIADKDYVKNASQHSNAKIVIALDVKNFYPSINRKKVLEIFQFFCKFPPDVSALLADLCCFKDSVPQGACSSSHLANLTLHNTEYSLVSRLQGRGYTYTRLLDDISISSAKEISKEEIEKIIKETKATLKSSELKLNNRKQKITSKSNPIDFMEVTGLWLNRGHPRAHRSDRKAIRAEMHKCQSQAAIDRHSEIYHQLHNSVSGKVAKLSYLNHIKAEKYRTILQSILPLYDEKTAHSITQQAKHLSKSKSNYRRKFVYFKKYYKIHYKVNILMRNNRKIAFHIKNILSHCKPLGDKDELLYDEPI